MPDSPFNNPFSGLSSRKSEFPEGKAPVKEKAAPVAPPRAVLRLEKKGRRGKEVTVVGQLALSPAQKQEWLSQLKAALGCGGALEGEELVLQGDHRDRLEAWLLKKGVAKISKG